MVSNSITCCSLPPWTSTPRGMKGPQHKKTEGALRPLERGLEGSSPERVVISKSCWRGMAASQPIEYKQRSQGVFEKKHDMEYTTVLRIYSWATSCMRSRIGWRNSTCQARNKPPMSPKWYV